MADPTGGADRGALRLDFDRRLMLQFRGSCLIARHKASRYRATLGSTEPIAYHLLSKTLAHKGEKNLMICPQSEYSASGIFVSP
jgi:hypothetical protein